MKGGPMVRFKRSALLLGPLLGLLGLATPTSVHAECTFNGIPPATEAARTAREIIVGTVVQNYYGSIDDFRLRIDHVLRGRARVDEFRHFKAVLPGWPLSTYPFQGKRYPPCSPIPGRKGDFMVFALDALAPDGETRYNAASWIRGRNVYDWDGPKTTLAEMRRLAALPQTDTLGVTSDPSSSRSQLRSATLALVFSSTFIAAMSWIGRSHRRDRRRT